MKIKLVAFSGLILWNAITYPTAPGQLHAGGVSKTEGGFVKHGDRTAQVTSIAPRTLEFAIRAMSSEYGWVVDYEDPVYLAGDTADDTPPAWRAAHPLDKGGVGIAGSKFTSTYDESNVSDLRTEQGEERAIRKVVDDYNASDEPGRFELRRDHGRIQIVGVSSKLSSKNQSEAFCILDAKITLNTKERNSEEAVDEILAAVSSATHIKAVTWELPDNLMPAKITIGGQNVAARELLEQVIAATGQEMYWDLLYEPDTPEFTLSFSLRRAVDHDGTQRRIRLIYNEPKTQ